MPGSVDESSLIHVDRCFGAEIYIGDWLWPKTLAMLMTDFSRLGLAWSGAAGDDIDVGIDVDDVHVGFVYFDEDAVGCF